MNVGIFNQKPLVSMGIPNGFAYFCTDKQTAEGQINGIRIYHKGNDVWVDALGRIVDDNYPIATKGTTEQRPTLTSTDEGFEYYDTTLKKKILWDGTKWVEFGSGGISNLVKLTQEEYDSLIEKDKDKLYVIVG